MAPCPPPPAPASCLLSCSALLPPAPGVTYALSPAQAPPVSPRLPPSASVLVSHWNLSSFCVAHLTGGSPPGPVPAGAPPLSSPPVTGLPALQPREYSAFPASSSWHLLARLLPPVTASYPGSPAPEPLSFFLQIFHSSLRKFFVAFTRCRRTAPPSERRRPRVSALRRCPAPPVQYDAAANLCPRPESAARHSGRHQGSAHRGQALASCLLLLPALPPC